MYYCLGGGGAGEKGSGGEGRHYRLPLSGFSCCVIYKYQVIIKILNDEDIQYALENCYRVIRTVCN